MILTLFAMPSESVHKPNNKIENPKDAKIGDKICKCKVSCSESAAITK